MVGFAVAQVSPAGGGPLAYVGTFLVATAFYALTAHAAARYVLGEVPLLRALAVGVVPAAVSLLLQQYGPVVVILVSLLADGGAISAVYRVSVRRAAAVAVAHYTVAAIAGLVVFNVVSLLASAPT